MLETKRIYKPSTKAIEEYHSCMVKNWNKAKAKSCENPWPIYEELNRIDHKRIFEGEKNEK